MKYSLLIGVVAMVTGLIVGHLPAQAADAPEPLAKGLAGVGLTGDDVNRAIEKGRKYLWEKPLGGGKEDLGDADDWFASLALVHAGAHKAFPAFDKALRKRLREISIADHVAWLGSYEVGVLSLLVESYGDIEFHWLLHSAVRFHVESQGPKGTFDYKAAQVDPIAKLLFEIEKARKSEEEANAIIVVGGQPLDLVGSGQAIKRLTARTAGADGDNSATQFALLGLWSGARSGLRIDADVWQRALDTILKRQNKDGGWDYKGEGAESYGSMTCAGICAIALCKHHLGQDVKGDPAIARGLAWLDKNWATDANPGNSTEYHHYYLYSIERVGRILDTEFIGRHEWYPLIARQLVKSQKPDGSWEEGGADPRRACSFALLALTRATPSLVIPTPRGGEGTLLAKTILGPPKRVFFVLDASGSMLANGNFDQARGAVQSLLGVLPEKTPAALRVFGHTHSPFDESAIDTAIEVPMRPVEKDAFLSKLSALCARGSSTLAANIAKAAADLKAANVSETSPAVLIIVSDGVESAEAAGKAATGAQALSDFKGLTACVLSLDTSRPDDAKMMERIAESAGGKCWGIGKLDDLRKHLALTLKRGPDGYVVVDAKNQKTEGSFNQPLKLKEGKYTFMAEFAGRQFRRDLWVNTEVTTTVTFAPEK